MRGKPVNPGTVDLKVHSDAHASASGGPVITQQHPKEQVDINTIVQRFGLTAEMPFGAAGGFYGDFTGINDFESALGLVEGAQERFMALPAHVRERFDNDPGKLIRYVQSASQKEYEELYNRREGSGSAATGGGEVKGEDKTK